MTVSYLTKFDTPYTARLYGLDPDDSLGQSLDGGSWYGLYRNSGGGGHIVVEDTYGFVGRVSFATTAALMLAWSELETEDDLRHDQDDDVEIWGIGL
jgi:hypothetical protein